MWCVILRLFEMRQRRRYPLARRRWQCGFPRMAATFLELALDFSELFPTRLREVSYMEPSRDGESFDTSKAVASCSLARHSSLFKPLCAPLEELNP